MYVPVARDGPKDASADPQGLLSHFKPLQMRGGISLVPRPSRDPS